VQKIGGVGKIVKLTKVSLENGNITRVQGEKDNGFGGVEQGNVNHMFLVSMPDRTKETLMNLIFQHIERGTRIISDVGRAMILGN
jgi:hypothetical protein